MRRVLYWCCGLSVLLAACQTADRSLPTLMSIPLQADSTEQAPLPTETQPVVLVVAPTQERTRSAIVLSETPTPSLTPTELPPLPSLAPTETQTSNAFSLTLAALTATPDGSLVPTVDVECTGETCVLVSTPTLIALVSSETPTTSSTDTITPTEGITDTPHPLTPLPPTLIGTNAALMPALPSVTPTLSATLAAWYTQNHTHAEKPVTLYDGPGTTYSAVGVLNPDIEVRIVERNRIGNWLHVRQTEEGKTLLDGWTLIGGLILESDLRFSQVPVNESLPDANMAQVRFQTTAALYAVPVIPYVSDSMREVYLRGQRAGINSQSITKIGDSVSANPLYLDTLSHKDTALGPYDYLADTVSYFGPSRIRESMAAKKGLSSFSVFDPMMAGEYCKANEAPLTCELRLQKPAVAFIMFGANDLKAMNVDEYKTQISLLVDDLLANGTIPILTTFSADPARRSWQESVAFNLVLLEIARTYDVPLMNLWLASRDLPKYGLEGDGIHMKNFGYDYLKLDLGLESRFGVSLQNLLALRTLEELRNTVMQP